MVESGGLPLRLPLGEHLADLGDVALPAASRVGIESEPKRHGRRRQQGELLGDVGLVHDPHSDAGVSQGFPDQAVSAG